MVLTTTLYGAFLMSTAVLSSLAPVGDLRDQV